MSSISDGMNKAVVSDQFRIIQQFALSLLRQSSLEDLTWDIASNAGRILGFEDCVVYLRDGDMLVQHAAYGLKNPAGRNILEPIQLPVGQGIVGTVAKTQIGEIVPDTSQDPRYIFDQFSGKSEITVPIIYEGRTIGILDSESSQPNNFSSVDFQLFQSVADIASSRIASAINECKLKQTQEKLVRHKEELESKVIERTQQISDTLQTVRVQEACLRITQNDLTRERDWLRNILESVSDGIIATDKEGNIQLVSDAAAKMIGNRDCKAGRPIRPVLNVESDCGSPFNDSGNLIETSLKGTIKTESGEERVINCSVKSVHDTGSSDLAFVISIQDITRQTFLEAEAEKAQRLDSLGILAGGIAHDFNNQLAAVSGLISAARFSERKDQSELLDLAEKTCLRSKKLTDQLLTLSSGGAPTIETCNITHLVNNAKMVASAGSSIEFEMEGGSDLPMVEADPGQIMQVFENIIINAQQAMNDSGLIRIKFDTVQIADSTMVQVTVIDDGPGIDARTLPRIFDPYFSTKSSGHGLGLTTSYSIIQRHHGQLSVSSKHGQGATFSVSLPAARTEIPTKVTAAEAKVNSLQILMLEDDELVQRSIAALLKSLGHHVTTASSGDEAVKKFTIGRQHNQPFDLAILDMTIVGGKGGLPTMLELKQLDAQLPVISMSGYNTDSLGKENAHFDGYLQKPFCINQLREAIDKVVPH